MTKRQTAKLNMFIAVLLFFRKDETIIATFLQLVNDIAGGLRVNMRSVTLRGWRCSPLPPEGETWRMDFG